MAKKIALFFIIFSLAHECVGSKNNVKNTLISTVFRLSTHANDATLEIFWENQTFQPLSKLVTQPLFSALEENNTALFINLYAYYCKHYEKKQIEHDKKGRTLLEVAIKKRNQRAINVILTSWQQHFYLFDAGHTKKDLTNVFHKMLDTKNRILIEKIITGLLQCPRCYSSLIIEDRNSEDKTPLDRALEQKIDPGFGQMVVHSCTNTYTSINEIQTFILEKTILAKKNHLWKSVAYLLTQYPDLCFAKELFEAPNREFFYKAMILVGFDPVKLQPPATRADPLLQTYKKLYRPGLTPSTLYFWTNLSSLTTSPLQRDLQIYFHKNSYQSR